MARLVVICLDRAPPSKVTPMPTPFKIDVPQATLDNIRRKVRDYEWHEMPRGDGLVGSWA